MAKATRKKPKKYPIVMIDVLRKAHVGKEQGFTYNAVTNRFQHWLLNTESGEYTGDEQLLMAKPGTKIEYGISVYYEVRADRAKQAISKLKKIIALYNAGSFASYKVSEPIYLTELKYKKFIKRLKSATTADFYLKKVKE